MVKVLLQSQQRGQRTLRCVHKPSRVSSTAPSSMKGHTTLRACHSRTCVGTRGSHQFLGRGLPYSAVRQAPGGSHGHSPQGFIALSKALGRGRLRHHTDSSHPHGSPTTLSERQNIGEESQSLCITSSSSLWGFRAYGSGHAWDDRTLRRCMVLPCTGLARCSCGSWLCSSSAPHSRRPRRPARCLRPET